MENPESRFAYPGLVRDFVHYGSTDAPLTGPHSYVVVDVETSGLHPQQGDRIIEIAAHRTTGDGTITQSWSTLINPQDGNVGLTELHGISAQMVQSAPTFAQVLPDLLAFMSQSVFVAHHALFDASFIAAEAKRSGVQIPVLPGLCTYWLARTVMHDMSKHKLGMLADRFNLINSLEHSASADAQVVVELLPHLLARSEQIKHYVPGLPQQEPIFKVATLAR